VGKIGLKKYMGWVGLWRKLKILNHIIQTSSTSRYFRSTFKVIGWLWLRPHEYNSSQTDSMKKCFRYNSW